MEFSSVFLQNAFEVVKTLVKGTSLRLDSKGKLVLSSSKIQKDDDLCAIQDVVNKIVEQLNAQFNSEQIPFYKEIFFRRMAHLSDEVFDRLKISDEILESIIPKYYSEYQEYRDEYHEVGPFELTQDMEYYRLVVKVIRLGLKLGVSPELVSEGVNGTYFLKDLMGRRLAVFKPRDEELLSKNSSSHMRRIRSLADILPICPTLIFLQGGNGYKSECMASLLSHKLEIYNVPTTKTESLKSYEFHLRTGEKIDRRVKKIGSLQLYLPTAEPAGKVLQLPRNLALRPRRGLKVVNSTRIKALVLEKISPQDFESMVIIDFLIAQLDRHPFNWYIDDQIYLIDNGATMPHKHSDSKISRRNQYAWQVLPQAKEPFGSLAQKKLKLFMKNKERIINLFYHEKLISDKRQVEKFGERAVVLCHFIKLRKTPRELASVRSSKDFKKVLKVIGHHASSCCNLTKI